jgi:hypothetical protein
MIDSALQTARAYRNLSPEIRQVAVRLVSLELDRLASDEPLEDRDLLLIRGRIQSAARLASDLQAMRNAQPGAAA